MLGRRSRMCIRMLGYMLHIIIRNLTSTETQQIAYLNSCTHIFALVEHENDEEEEEVVVVDQNSKKRIDISTHKHN